MIRILLDMDVGIDDALAIMYLAGRPDIEILGLGSVYGNCSVEHATGNALRVLKLCGLGQVPVAAGASAPLSQELSVADFVHGRDGLADLDWPEPAGHPVAESAVEQILRLSREHPGEVDLLAVGPLTNLALAVTEDPEVLTRFRSVVIMGGSGPFPQVGEIREVDANIHNDCAAADIVFSASRTRMVMVGVNVTTRVILDEVAVARIAAASTPQAQFASAIIDRYLDFYQHKWGRRVSPMHDALAAGVLVSPEIVTSARTGPVNIIDDGAMRRAWLMQRADGGVLVQQVRSAPATTVVTAVAGKRFVEEFLSILTSSPREFPRV